MPRIITKADYNKLTPRLQGYAQYWQGGMPGSELKELRNPYPDDTYEHKWWDEGQAQACQDAQDSEG